MVENKPDQWIVCIDRGGSCGEERLTEGVDEQKICLRIGQMMLCEDIERIIVYRNGEEYRRYERKRNAEKRIIPRGFGSYVDKRGLAW
jgi:hypothetical protein